MSLTKAVAFIRRAEGGAYYPTHGAYDPNPTMFGITQATFEAAGYTGLVYGIIEAEWAAIFERLFWRKAGCHIWPEPLDLVVADPAFNSGPKQALKFLQRGVSATPDGMFGPQTVELVLAVCAKPDGTKGLCIRVQGQRIRFLRDLYTKSLQRQADWDHASPETRLGVRPKLAPISSWLGRVDSLARTVGLY